MAFSYPDYADLTISQYDLIFGYYTLGFCQYHRPDCVWITPDMWQSSRDFSWLQSIIERHLPTKKICIVVWDEEIIGHANSELASVINQYCTESLYLITQLSESNQEIYRRISQFRCKIIELPWWHLNDVLTYYAVRKIINNQAMPQLSTFQYLCMVGNAYSSHKTDLISYLKQKNLHKHGLITVQSYDNHPPHFQDFVLENPCPPYQNLGTKWQKMAAQHKIGNLWISANVENFLHIEQTYHMPLVIHPETSPGIFFSTEKSIWPALLGKMYLIYGGPGCMSWIQQFHDVPQTKYADLRFDSIKGEYTRQDYLERLDVMLEDNRYLIEHATEIYREIKEEMQESRWSLGKNLYDFFINQLSLIT